MHLIVALSSAALQLVNVYCYCCFPSVTSFVNLWTFCSNQLCCYLQLVTSSATQPIAILRNEFICTRKSIFNELNTIKINAINHILVYGSVVVIYELDSIVVFENKWSMVFTVAAVATAAAATREVCHCNGLWNFGGPHQMAMLQGTNSMCVSVWMTDFKFVYAHKFTMKNRNKSQWREKKMSSFQATVRQQYTKKWYNISSFFSLFSMAEQRKKRQDFTTSFHSWFGCVALEVMRNPFSLNTKYSISTAWPFAFCSLFRKRKRKTANLFRKIVTIKAWLEVFVDQHKSDANPTKIWESEAIIRSGYTICV